MSNENSKEFQEQQEICNKFDSCINSLEDLIRTIVRDEVRRINKDEER